MLFTFQGSTVGYTHTHTHTHTHTRYCVHTHTHVTALVLTAEPPVSITVVKPGSPA